MTTKRPMFVLPGWQHKQVARLLLGQVWMSSVRRIFFLRSAYVPNTRREAAGYVQRERERCMWVGW